VIVDGALDDGQLLGALRFPRSPALADRVAVEGRIVGLTGGDSFGPFGAYPFDETRPPARRIPSAA
jgi:hypothetical protein